MKILDSINEHNWQYIIPRSNKWATIFLSIFSAIALIVPTDLLLSFIDNMVLRIFVAILVLLLVYLIILLFVIIHSKRVTKVKLFDLHSNHALFLEYGDLFSCESEKTPKNIAFAGNRCFDTIVDDDLVGSNKIHGMALNRIYKHSKRNSDTVNDEIQKDLSVHNYSYVQLNRDVKRSGNLCRYNVGSVVEIPGLNSEKYFILGLTYFNNELRARIEKEDYTLAITSLVKYISNRSQGFPTYMPVIGAGCADVGTVDELLDYIIKTIKLFKDDLDCDIHIVVNNKNDILNLLKPL